jgi:RelA/SpoT family (p)ppGpp synthetase
MSQVDTSKQSLDFAKRTTNALKRAIGLKPEPQPASAAAESSAPAEEVKPVNPVASANDLAERCRLYLSASDVNKIREAFRYADEAHLGQLRNSGLPYITHPISVAEILASWHMDAQVIEAGLMHDVLEDTGVTKIEMSEKFGVPVAELVDGVSKLDKLKFSSNEEAQAESFYKMLLAMSRDVRVILIKLADRLHNMRTLGAVKPHKKFRIAKETMEIYVAIAHRLGMYSVYRELSDVSFSFMYPRRFRILQNAVRKSRERRSEALLRIKHEVQDELNKAHLRAEVFDKEKGLWRIYSKMKERHIRFSEVLDVHSFRIIVPTREDCYRALGILHGLYKPVPGRFKDFVAIPKSNGYQSLHTTVLGPKGLPVEFQIRTQEMHHICEDGITAHWLYRDRSGDALQISTKAWLDSLLDIQRQSGTSLEFMENIKVEIFPDRVYVFSPKGKIIQLPKGSTPVDFAYQIHSDVGNSCVGCRINGEHAPLTHQLKNGEMVEIITAEKPCPNPQWLATVRTGRARAEIRQFLRNQDKEGSVELGRMLLRTIAHEQHQSLAIPTEADWERVYKSNGFASVEELFSAIGTGQKEPSLILHQLVSASRSNAADKEKAPVLGLGGKLWKLAPCCTPIPTDELLGHYIESSNTVHLHRKDCSHCQRGFRVDPENWRTFLWASELPAQFACKLDIDVYNAHETMELVTAIIAQNNSSITGFNMLQVSPDVSRLTLTVQVANSDHLSRIINRIRELEPVRLVSRHLERDHQMKPVDVEED